MTILLTSLSASTTTLLISAGIRKFYLISICIPVVFFTQLVSQDVLCCVVLCWCVGVGVGVHVAYMITM